MRARNMQVLTEDVQWEWPGTTVWGKGDAAHQSSSSDHNEDDTPGSKPEQTDADSVPEHRAIDIPFLGPFNLSTARTLRARLTDRPENRSRLKYVILEQSIWRRNGGWVEEHYNGEYHSHLHVSGWVGDDENGDPWDIGPEAPQRIQKRGIEMFLIHKVIGGVATYALVGTPGAIVWRVTDTLTTPEGPIGGQDYANAWARSLGDSRLETSLAFAALTMPRPVIA